MKQAVTISGSFQRALEQIRADIKEFEKFGYKILSPRMFQSHVNENGFVILDSDGGRRPAAIHGRHLVSISQSDLLWVRNPKGYVGLSTALEIGYAEAIGVPVYSSEEAADSSLNRYIKVAGSPTRALEMAKRRDEHGESQPSNEYDPQMAVAHMSAACGFEQETDQEILGLLDEEVGELKDAVNKGRFDAHERHSVSEELADCAIYLYHLANQSGIDLAQSIRRKIAINRSRWGRKRETG